MEVILSNPVVSSNLAPVRDLYSEKALLAIRIRVVPDRYNQREIYHSINNADLPVSTTPAVSAKIIVVPYRMDWLMPQNSLAGEVVVIGLKIFWKNK